jgi:hypothetical protein
MKIERSTRGCSISSFSTSTSSSWAVPYDEEPFFENDSPEYVQGGVERRSRNSRIPAYDTAVAPLFFSFFFYFTFLISLINVTCSPLAIISGAVAIRGLPVEFLSSLCDRA